MIWVDETLWLLVFITRVQQAGGVCVSVRVCDKHVVYALVLQQLEPQRSRLEALVVCLMASSVTHMCVC